MKNNRFLTGIFGILLIAGLFWAGCKGAENETAPDTFTVTYNANGGGTAPAKKTVEEGTEITLPGGDGLSKTGYTFGGWNTEADGFGNNYSAGSSFTVTGDVTLYAKWDISTYTVQFNANEGNGNVPNQSADAGGSITLPDGNALSKSGFKFGGWKADAQGAEPLYTAGQLYTVNNDTTLYAHWLADSLPEHTVTYDANGGNGTVPGEQKATQGAGILVQEPENITNTGKTFSGWNTNATGNGTSYAPGTSLTVTGNITLYAQWLDNTLPTFTVTYNANGGGGTVPGIQTVNQGATVTVAEKGGLTDKQDSVFDGWNTRADGLGTSYDVGASLTVNADIVLYAKWITLFTVTFSANGGNGTPPAAIKQASPQTAITLPPGTGLSKSGFTFGGWNTNTAGTGTNYIAGAQYTPTINTTLHAKWNTATTPEPFNNITATEWVSQVNVGWNLGNALDAWINSNNADNNPPNTANGVTYLETFWGAPVTTERNIDTIKYAGFNAIRIPVSWSKAADPNNGWAIRTDWMNRVKAIVDYAVDNDMYILLNTHHDETGTGENGIIMKGFLNLNGSSSEVDAGIDAFGLVWAQIADVFKDYNEKLVFEGLNEPRTLNYNNGDWVGNATNYANLNRYYQKFVDVVRASGGNNDKRILMINTYAASTEDGPVNGLALPTDTVANKLIVSYHAYEPFQFAHEGNQNSWSAANSGDTNPITSRVDKFVTKFVDNGIPVIIGEMGARISKNNDNQATRAAWAKYYVDYAKAKGIKCFWWDENENFMLLDRAYNTITYPAIVMALTGLSNIPEPPPEQTTVITLPANQYADGGAYSTYEVQLNPLPANTRITAGETYTFNYSLTADKDLNVLNIALVDTRAAVSYWKVLSQEPFLSIGTNISAGEVVSGSATLIVSTTAGDATAAANKFVLNAGPVPGNSSSSVLTLTFTTYSLTKN